MLKGCTPCKIIKNPIRNTLDVDTVSSLLQIKSYYNEEEQFEPDEDHYFFINITFMIFKLFLSLIMKSVMEKMGGKRLPLGVFGGLG